MRALLIGLLLMVNNAFATTETITVSVKDAMICAPSIGCYPVLLGRRTPTGEYPIMHARITAPGYGGDVLAFKQVIPSPVREWFSIHRVWTRNPEQRRIEKIYGPVEGRRFVSDGCINVMPDVYTKLVDCCSQGRIVIE